eukprot:IDg11782t1
MHLSPFIPCRSGGSCAWSYVTPFSLLYAMLPVCRALDEFIRSNTHCVALAITSQAGRFLASFISMAIMSDWRLVERDCRSMLLINAYHRQSKS